MKKLLVVLVSLSLVSNGSLYSMTKIKESFKKTRKHWQCITKPKKNKCTPEERKKARKWLIYTPTAIVVSLLFAAGIVATGAYVAKKKGESPETEEEKKYVAAKEVGKKEQKERPEREKKEKEAKEKRDKEEEENWKKELEKREKERREKPKREKREKREIEKSKKEEKELEEKDKIARTGRESEQRRKAKPPEARRYDPERMPTYYKPR